MKKNADEKETSAANSLSRRQWLGKISAPAVAVVGASMIGTSANATGNETGDQKLRGASIYNIRDFGAKGDGKTLDTIAIQKAIDACNKDQGGTVLVPAGKFVCGTIELKSNVTLQL